MEINTLKSICMIFNSVDVVTGKFLGMDVVEQIKYLGVTATREIVSTSIKRRRSSKQDR